MRRGRGIRVGLGCAFAALLIGGCGLHTPSGVRVDQRSGDTAVDEPDIRKLPPGPVQGASPAQIVTGFLEASAADPDHSFALEFLTAGASWRSRDSATVYEQQDVTSLKATTHGDVSVVTFSAPGVGAISSGGAFLPSQRQLNLSFKLRRDDGQWRLTSVPDGVLLTPRDLSRSYRPVRSYSFSTDGSVLVPEPGYVVSDQAGLAGAALHALLTDWGNPAGAVAGGLPQGLTSLGSVVVTDGEATVDLGREAFTVPQSKRSRVVDQIAATLATVPGVFSVRVLVEERPYAGGPVAAQIPQNLLPRSTGPAFGVGPNGQLLYVTGRRTVPVTWAKSKAGSGAGLIADPVSAPGGRTLAALRVTPLGDQLLLADLSKVTPQAPAPVATLKHAKALVAPTHGEYLRPQWLDSSRLLLAVGGSTPSFQLVDPSDGSLNPVYAPNLQALGPLSALEISRDGTRAIAVAGAPGARNIYLGRVTTPASAPGSSDQLIVDGWTQLATTFTDVAAASWSGDLAVTVVGTPGRTAAAGPELATEAIALDDIADPTPLEAPPAQVVAAAAGGITLATAPERAALISAGGQSWLLQDEHWLPLGSWSSPAYP